MYKEAIQVLRDMCAAGLSPDLATITDMVAALEEGGMTKEAETVFKGAVQFGTLPPSMLDSDWEVDVSDLPPAVARLKMRSMLQSKLKSWNGCESDVKDMVFICGTGMQRSVKVSNSRKFDLRSYLMAALGNDYSPPLAAHRHPVQHGCIIISAQKLTAWMKSQNVEP